MKKMIGKTRYAIGALLTLMFLSAASVYAVNQDPYTLKIGDAAPQLKYSKWIKGTPVDTYKADQTYIVEFWATWCGPCIAAMPHLSDLAEKYKDKVTVIGANVWEKTGDKPYESSLPGVVRFVEGNAKNMRYNILADTKDQYLANQWLKPAGITGIPSTFIIQKGKIVWVGHPVNLDEVIGPLLEGTYDVAANQARYNAAKEAQAKAGGAEAKMYKPITDALAVKDYSRVLKSIDSLEAVFPDEKKKLQYLKFDALMILKKKEALAHLQGIVKENPGAGANSAFKVSEHDGQSRELYEFAIEVLKGFTPQMSLALNAVATMQAKIGDFRAAAETQLKALELVKVELKDPKFSGRVFEYNITDYQKKVEEYKGKVKN